MWNGGFMSRVMTGAVARRRIDRRFIPQRLSGGGIDSLLMVVCCFPKRTRLSHFFFLGGGIFMIIYHIHIYIISFLHIFIIC